MHKLNSRMILALAALAAGCVSAPGYQEPDVRVPAAFTATSTRTSAGVAEDTCPPVPVAGQPAGAPAASSVIPRERAQQVTEGSAAPRPEKQIPRSLRSLGMTGEGERSLGMTRAGHPERSEGSAPPLTAHSSDLALGDSTLALLIQEAERANTDTRVAEARLTSARAARRLAAYDLVPSITASGSSMRQQLSMAQVPGLGSQLPAQQLWDVGFDASWELDLFGRVSRNVAARSAFVESAQHGLDDVRVSIAAEVARTYFELRGAQRQLAVSERTAENQRRTVKLTEDRLAAGQGTAFDRERARAALYLTQSTIPDLESRIAQQKLQLGVLLGRAPDALPRALDDSGALPRLPDSLNVGTPAELVRRRPDVLAAERQLAARSMLVSVAHAEYLPRVALAARAGYVATSFDSLTRSGTSRILVGPVLSWPLFDLTRVKEHVDLARADEDEARAEHDAVVLQALQETDAALVAYDKSHARLAILEDAVQASRHAVDLSQQRFEAGLTDILQVLDAQRTLLDAEEQLAQGHTAAATAYVAVYKAVGGTWSIR